MSSRGCKGLKREEQSNPIIILATHKWYFPIFFSRWKGVTVWKWCANHDTLCFSRWNGVAVWKWCANDDTCGICRFPFHGCCPDCKYAGAYIVLTCFLFLPLSPFSNFSEGGNLFSPFFLSFFLFVLFPFFLSFFLYFPSFPFSFLNIVHLLCDNLSQICRQYTYICTIYLYIYNIYVQYTYTYIIYMYNILVYNILILIW